MKKTGVILSTVSLLALSASSAFAQINLQNTALNTGIISKPLSVNQILTWAISVLFAVAAFAAIAFLIWGGIKWISSGGDKGKVDSARGTIVAAIIGLIIVILSFVILNFIIQILGAGSGVFNICIPSLSTGQCVQ